MSSRLIVTLAGIWLASATLQAHSEPIAFGTSQAGSATYGIALALAKEAKERSGLDIRATPFRSGSQVVPLVNSGELQLGATSAMELTAAIGGEDAFTGNAMPNLRAIGNMFPFRVTFAVKADNPAKTVADIKGQRVPSGYRAASTGALVVGSILAATGLTYEDVEAVEVTDYSAARDAFRERRVDINQIVIGSGGNAQLAEQVGGLRSLSIPVGVEVDARLKAMHPAFRSVLAEAGSDVTVDENITVVAYDYVLYANADLADEIAAEIAGALADGAAAMSESVPGFKSFDATRVASDVGVPFHPGALEAYKERGLLPASQ
jgi:hypothetical protein